MPKSAKESALRQAHAIAAQIPYRANKKPIILAWCAAVKKALVVA